MIAPRKEIARERRRQMQVRKAFDAGLARHHEQRHQLTAFHAACGEYLVYSMDRLHEQDQLIHDLLAERIPTTDEEAHHGLAELNARWAASRIVVDSFRHALAEFKQAGDDGGRTFEQAAMAFSDAFNRTMTPRRNPFFRYTDSLFIDADWARIANVSDEFHRTENSLFSHVTEEAPQAIDPTQYQVSHPPGE